MKKVQWCVLGTADIAQGATIPGMLIPARLERHRIVGTRGILSSETQFNQSGELTYTVTAQDGRKTVKTVTARNNYCLEVEQLGDCILHGASPLVSREFSLLNARVTDRILSAIGY